MAPRVTLQGFHAIKHAIRFGARIETLYVLEGSNWQVLATGLAPDVLAVIEKQAAILPHSEFSTLGLGHHPTGMVAVAVRPESPSDILATLEPQPIVLLEDPRRLGNVGAVVRVAAGLGAAAVVTTGELDPWQAEALRGSAGLHFALPVIKISLDELPDRPIYAFDEGGEGDLLKQLPTKAILAFGTERSGLSDTLRARADALVAIPMQPGVSSLNLATSVAIGLGAATVLRR